MEQLNFFNPVRAQELKAEGMKASRENPSRSYLLRIAREGARRAAEERLSRTATADDAYLYLTALGYDQFALGNAAGSLFRGKEWESTGGFRASRRTSNRGHLVRVWRLK